MDLLDIWIFVVLSPVMYNAIWCFVAEMVAMVYRMNWSREVGINYGNTSAPAQPACKTLPYVLGVGCWLGRALVLPQSPTSPDQFPLYHYIIVAKFCFKYRSKLSCCCNILDGAINGTSYNNRMLQLLREEFIYNNNLLPQRWERITCTCFQQ